MIVSEPWGVIGKYTKTNYIAHTKKEKEIIINYLISNFTKFELKVEKVNFKENMPFKNIKSTYWYLETTTKETITEEKIMKWYNNKKGGENNMHETTN